MFFIFLLGMTEEMLHSFWILDEKKQLEVSCVCAGLFDVELMYTLREISGTWKSLTQFFCIVKILLLWKTHEIHN